MPLSDQARISQDRERPRVVALWQALSALRSTVSFMNTGAHPDDETSAMLAALRFRDGVDISYACSTRGEGGQNDIGTETGAALGTLRTAEMEAACDRLDLRMYWLSTSPQDTIFDFGFSKSGDETLAKWNRDRTLARFVDIIRTERPDIICPTFLDVPGQHGHHRAMTEAAHLVMGLAADPDFTGSDLPVWQVKKMYLPAWSGAGQAYDDDMPPPVATLTYSASDQDPVTGWSFARIGQQSRLMHATQAMGRWVPTGKETDFPLHLAKSFVPEPDQDITSGLALTLRDLGMPDLDAAQDACDAAIDAFPNTVNVAKHASDALQSLRKAVKICSAEMLSDFGHKLSRKDEQLACVIHLAAGVDARASLQDEVLHPGGHTTITREVTTWIGTARLTPILPDGWSYTDEQITLGNDAAISDPYPSVFLPTRAARPCFEVSLTTHGVTTTLRKPFEVPPVVIPHRSAALAPISNVINLATQNRSVVINTSDISPPSATPKLLVPDSWSVSQQDGQITVTAPNDIAPGLYDLTLTLDGTKADSVQHIRRDHTTPRVMVAPAIAQVRVVDAKLPDVRVGYIGAGNDQVGDWLSRMGLSVNDLSVTQLTDAVLAAHDTLVVGIFAMRFRAGLSDAMPRIHEWVRAGGTLITLYHRPWDNWDPDNTAPYRLEIGQPSLRWRVTNETANVTILAENHPVLTHPNLIGEADWAGWDKERGLYFAKDWDAAYTPLIEMHDTDEPPLQGGLLAADVGRGRHVHTSLILHHQLEKLTPGAFRLMANLMAKRKKYRVPHNLTLATR